MRLLEKKLGKNSLLNIKKTSISIVGDARFSYVIVYNQSLLYHLPNLSRLEEKHETR
jgi:hypothetical protein